ncbi:MAG: sugar transferase [Spirosoma sp.]|nr:sugar transferase [Spirosoma sp.]
MLALNGFRETERKFHGHAFGQYQNIYDTISKRIFDLVVAGLVAILVLSWLLPLVGLLIRLTSRGPILFLQRRTGINGKPFLCFKFRTMVHNSQHEPFKQTAFNDSRVTAIGHWLRKTNIDEFPQFINVLKGDMSIVGPRPHALQHDAEYWDALPNYPKRYTTLPGITGLAQVSGARGIADDISNMEKRLSYDLIYIQHNSLSYDAKICWWILKSMVLGDPNAW